MNLEFIEIALKILFLTLREHTRNPEYETWAVNFV